MKYFSQFAVDSVTNNILDINIKHVSMVKKYENLDSCWRIKSCIRTARFIYRKIYLKTLHQNIYGIRLNGEWCHVWSGEAHRRCFVLDKMINASSWLAYAWYAAIQCGIWQHRLFCDDGNHTHWKLTSQVNVTSHTPSSLLLMPFKCFKHWLREILVLLWQVPTTHET